MPSEQERLASKDLKKAILLKRIEAKMAEDQQRHRSERAEKHLAHEERHRARLYEDAKTQRARDDDHRRRLTWISAGLMAFMIIAVGVAYLFNAAVGDKVLTPAFTFIGVIAGGLGIGKSASPRPSSESDSGKAS